MYKAVVFDLDGTLLDSLTDIVKAANYTLSEMNFPQHTFDEYKSMVGYGVPTLVHRFLPVSNRNHSVEQKAIEIFLSYYNIHKEDNTIPYPGILSLLKELQVRDIKLGVVSNKEDWQTKHMVEHYLPNIFDMNMVCGHIEGVNYKPDPYLINKMRINLNLKKSEVLYVGDTIIDIEMAHNAGMLGCGVTWGFQTETDLNDFGADYIVHKSKEILELTDDYK